MVNLLHIVRGVIFALVGAVWLQAGEATVFVGTSTREKGKGIWSCAFDTDSGKLSAARLVFPVAESGFLAVSPDGKFLYATNGRENTLAAFRIMADGGLEEINRQPTHSRGPCHVWATATDLFSANYSGGSVTVCPINPDGSLRAASAVATFSGSGPDKQWQNQPYAHGVCTDASGRFVYVCDRGSDRVWSFRLDSETHTLTPTDPPAGITPAGTGPRHAVVSADGRFLYANSEMGRDVTVFARDANTGALTWLAAHSVLPDPNVRGGWTAEIALHPSGKWLYVSVRGHNLLSLFAVGEDGALTWKENIKPGVEMPRSFAISRDGRWLIVAGVDDNRLQVNRIDPVTGKLTVWGEPVSVPAPYCVVIRQR